MGILFLLLPLTGFAHPLVSAPQILDRPLVVSLARRPHRFEETKLLMQTAGFTNIERFEAVDGFFADQELFEELNILYKGHLGAKGCAASHLTIWRDFAYGDDLREYLFVCEDDMVPHSQFPVLFPFFWEKTPEVFDLLMVGSQMGHKLKHSPGYLVSFPSLCTHAYIISKRGAKKLFELYQNLPENSGDLYVIDLFLFEQMQKGNLTYYCYEGRFFPDLPNLKAGKIFKTRDCGICFQNQKFETTIKKVD